MKKLNERGVGALAALALVLVVGAIGGIGWFVYHSSQATTKTLDQSAAASNSDNAQKAAKPQTKTSQLTEPDLPADFLACVKKSGASLEGDDKTVICVKDNAGATIQHAALPEVKLPATNSSMVGWKDLPVGLQATIKSSWPTECTAANQQADAVLADVLTKLADDKKSAVVPVGCDGGAAHLMALAGSTWKDIAHTQMEFSCQDLLDYSVPKSVVENSPDVSTRCFDNLNIERVITT
jgi:hypothetical protein